MEVPRSRPTRYGTNLVYGFLYGFYEIWYGSYGICMIIILPKPRVLLGFPPNPKIMESKVDKPSP